jgi:electron transport complex protein RnfD
MWGIALALCPAVIWGIFCFGAAAVWPVAIAISAAIFGESLIGAISHRFTLRDGSAFLTGLLIGMGMPPGLPLYIPAAASLFAIVIIKGAFGGLGSNWMNPALGGIVFALLNWPREMNVWLIPQHLAGVGGVSGATPLGFIRERITTQSIGTDPLSLLGAGGMRFSAIDRNTTDFLNTRLFSHFGADLPRGYMDLLMGNRPGALGELSGILILAASIVVLSRRMIRWEIPVSIIASNTLLVWIFGGLSFGNGFFKGDVLFSLLSGSFLIVAFFMATDPVTSPSSTFGMLLYGTGIGLLTYIIRTYGSVSEGSAFAVLIMNCFTPFLSGIHSASRGGFDP